jgi:hypothetical protein
MLLLGWDTNAPRVPAAVSRFRSGPSQTIECPSARRKHVIMRAGISSELLTLARARATALVPPPRRQPWLSGLVWAAASFVLLSIFAALIGARSANATTITAAMAVVIGAIAFADGALKYRRNQSEYQEALAYLKIFGVGMNDGAEFDSFGNAVESKPAIPLGKADAVSAAPPKRAKTGSRPRRKRAVSTGQPSP